MRNPASSAGYGSPPARGRRLRDGIQKRKRRCPSSTSCMEELVTANRVLAREGDRGCVRARQRAASGQSAAFSAVAGARAGLHRGRRHHGVHARRRARRCEGPRALSRALHPWRRLRGAAGRPFGGAQSFAERDPVRHHQATSSSRSCTCAPISATTCRSGTRTTSSATPRCWSRTWRWAATSPGHGGGPHHPDARPRRDRAGAQYPARGVHLGLSRGQRQAADAGDGDGRHQIPHRPARSTRSSNAPAPTRINRAWENWCRRADRPVTDVG